MLIKRLMLLDGSVIKVGGIVYGTVLPDANVGVCEKLSLIHISEPTRPY